MKNILNDSSKFQKVHIEHDSILNHLIHMKNRVTHARKNLRDKKEVSVEPYGDFSNPSSSAVMCSLAKLKKIVSDCLSFFRLILPAISTATYKLAKFLIPMLEARTTNEYTVKDFFAFAKELQSFNSKLVMVSFHILKRLIRK